MCCQAVAVEQTLQALLSEIRDRHAGVWVLPAQPAQAQGQPAGVDMTANARAEAYRAGVAAGGAAAVDPADAAEAPVFTVSSVTMDGVVVPFPPPPAAEKPGSGAPLKGAGARASGAKQKQTIPRWRLRLADYELTK